MFMYRVLSGIAAIAFGAAVVLVIPGVSPEVEASSPAPVVKADRLDYRPTGQACTQQAWPYYEASCLRDRNQPNGQPRVVRVISTDRHIAR